jgi:hypothetical protein
MLMQLNRCKMAVDNVRYNVLHVWVARLGRSATFTSADIELAEARQTSSKGDPMSSNCRRTLKAQSVIGLRHSPLIVSTCDNVTE